MIRPATPVSILFLAAFVLVLLATLSTPVIKGIHIASSDGVNYGVFGSCPDSGDCSGIQIGYNTDQVAATSSTFSLSSSTRHTVSYLLIIHPVAALLSLICFALAVASHFHAPSHSPRFLLGLFILTIPTFLLTLLAFIADILLFIPHVAWGGWVVLAAAIILLICSIVTCGMRRSLVGRKARRKRIAENAEMSGENYFNNLNAKHQTDAAVATLPRAESPPPLSGSSVVPLTDKSPYNYSSAGYEKTDDRTPLNANAGPPSVRSNSRPGYNEPMRSRAGSVERGVDQYGNPLQPGMAVSGRRPSVESERSQASYYSRGGRGGYPPGRGGYPNRGGPMMRGGMRGPPPSGWRGGRGGGPGPGMGAAMGAGAGMVGGAAMSNRIGPLPGQGPPQDPYHQPYPQQREMQPIDTRGSEIGQAMEMDATNGVPSPIQSPVGGNAPSEFVPARSAWNSAQSSSAPVPASGARGLSPIEASPRDSSSKYSSTQGPHRRTASGSYYEDVDPRFADPAPPAGSAAASLQSGVGQIPTIATAGHIPQPRSAFPGPAPTSNPEYNPNMLHPNASQQDLHAQGNPAQGSQESLQEGQRSPAASDTSHFTSVSQRGINPNWRPPPGSGGPMMGGPQGYGRPPPHARNQNDVLLNSNPDFSIPGVGMGGPVRGRGGLRGRGGSGMGRNSPAMGLGANTMSPGYNSGPGGGGSRYPMP